MRADSENLLHIDRGAVYDGMRLNLEQFAHTIYGPILVDNPGQHSVEKIGMNDE